MCVCVNDSTVHICVNCFMNYKDTWSARFVLWQDHELVAVLYSGHFTRTSYIAIQEHSLTCSFSFIIPRYCVNTPYLSQSATTTVIWKRL